MRPKRAQPTPSNANAAPPLTFQTIQALYTQKSPSCSAPAVGCTPATPTGSKKHAEANSNNIVNNAAASHPIEKVNQKNSVVVPSTDNSKVIPPASAIETNESTTTLNTHETIVAALRANTNLFPHTVSAIRPGCTDNDSSLPPSQVPMHRPLERSAMAKVLYPSDMGPLKAGKRAQQGLPSGTHIRRRPPSVPRRGLYDCNTTDFTASPAVPLEETGSTSNANTAAVTAPGQTSGAASGLFSRDARPLKYERRSDPSPAPSRHPRGNRRKRMPSTFSSTNSAAKPDFTRLSRYGSDVAEEGRRPPSGRQPLGAIPSALRAAKPDRTEVMKVYLSLCRQLGETVNTEWVDLLSRPSPRLEDAVENNPTDEQDIGGKSSSGRKPLLAGAGRGEAPIRAKSPGGAARSWTCGSHGGRVPRSNSVSRLGGIGRPALFPPAGSPLSFKSSLSFVQRSATDVCVDQVVAYCEQHLLPYQAKMDAIRQRRETVQRSLHTFLHLCHTPEVSVETSHSVLKSPLESQRHMQENVGNATSSLQGSPRVEKIAMPSTVIGLQERVRAMSDGLAEVQSSVVQLLLRLADCAKEVRKPLGSATAAVNTATTAAVGPHAEADDARCMSIGDSRRGSLVDSEGPALSSSLTIPVLALPVCGRRLPNSAHPTHIGSSVGPTPPGYADLVTQQERDVAIQLHELRKSVVNALYHDPTVHIADAGMLLTPLFIPTACTEEPLHQPSAKESSKSSLRSPRVAQGKAQAAGGRVTPRAALTPRRGAARTPRVIGTATVVTPRTAAVGGRTSAATTPRGGKVATKGGVPPDGKAGGKRIPLQPHFVLSLTGDAGGFASHRSDSSGSVVAVNPILVLGGAPQSNRPLGASPRSLESSAPSILAAGPSPAPQKRQSRPGVNDHEKGIKARSRSSSVGAGKRVMRRSASASLRSGVKHPAEASVNHADFITAAQLKRARMVWDVISASLALPRNSETLTSVASRHSSLPPGTEMCTEPPVVQTLQMTAAGEALPNEMAPVGTALSTPTVVVANALSPVQVPSNAAERPNVVDRTTVLRHTCTTEPVRQKSNTASAVSAALPEGGHNWDEDRPQLNSPMERDGAAVTVLPPAPNNCTSVSVDSLAKPSTAKPVGPPSVAQVLAMNVILPWWRRYRASAQRHIEFRRAHAATATVQTQMVREYRVKSFLRQLVRRRRLSRALQAIQPLVLTAAERITIVDSIIATGVCPSLTNFARHHTAATGGSHSPTESATQSTDIRARSQRITTRQRFQQAREQRKSMTETVRSPSTTAGTKPRTVSLPLQGVSPTIATSDVPPLPLIASGISTKAIANYNTDADGFEVAAMHRLLRAPQFLLYATHVAIDRYPTQPPMGYARLKEQDGDSSVDCSRSPSELSKRGRSQCRSQPRQPAPRSAGGRHGGGTTSPEVIHVPFSVVRKYLRYAVCIPDPKGNALPHASPPYSSASLDGSSGASSCDTPSTKTTTIAREEGVPKSVRYQSIVSANELRHEAPVVKPFSRPFERWGLAHGFTRRIFTAAAIYAWKLIFSHTPHDDRKQTMLRSQEEQLSRLERVYLRNRMILACYCVRTEREWIREASKDLSFVGQIWSPKKSMDPNDPDIDQQCRETYAFVEDFLYQCFPSANTLEDVPPFLLGAGIYFAMKEALNYDDTSSSSSHTASFLRSGYFAQHFPDSIASPAQFTRDQNLWTPYDLNTIQKYEQVSLLDRLSVWWHRSISYHDEQRAAPKDNKRGSKHDAPSAFLKPTETSTSCGPTPGDWLGCSATLTKCLASSTPATPALLSSELLTHSPVSAPAFDGPKESDQLRSDDDDEFHVVDGHHMDNARKDSSYCGSIQCSNKASSLQHGPGLGVELVRVPDAATKVYCPEYKEVHKTLKQRETMVLQALAQWVQAGENCIGGKNELVVLYPKRFLVKLCERLSYELLGLQLNLEVCEDLDCVD